MIVDRGIKQRQRLREKARIAAALFSCIMLLLIGGACSKMKEFASTGAPYFTDDYRGICDRWSRESRIHYGLEVRLIASATFKSDEFTRAYVEEYAKAYQLADVEKARLTQDLLQKGRERHEFVLAIFVPEKKWDEFDKNRSMWKLYLVNDNNTRVAPLEIKRLGSKDGIEEHFFSYITPWKTVYAVTFPASVQGSSTPIVDETTKTLRLVITSVQGTAEMVWALR